MITDIEDKRKYMSLDLKNDDDIDTMAALCDALGNKTRLKILRYLQQSPYIFTVPELAKGIKMPMTTFMFHLEKLQKAGVISVWYKSGTHGALRLVQRKLKTVDISLFYTVTDEKNIQSEIQSVGVGQFSDFTGGSFNFCTENKHYTFFTDNCYSPERFGAQLVYTSNGQITYRFSNIAAKMHTVKSIELSLEICSEAPYFDNDFLSDITFWINDTEILTYTCPGDFGDHIGKLNPEWWSSRNTQHGELLTITVDDHGVMLNGKRIQSKVTLKKLLLDTGNKIEIRFGNKSNARNVGGFNIFGKRFGDYPQDIDFIIRYNDDR